MKYSEVREQMQDGDLLLWRGTSLIARAIQLFGERYNHASFVVITTKYDIKRVLLYEALSHGIEPTFLSVRLEKYKGTCYWLKLNKEYEGYRGALYQAANNYVGTGYDYRSLLANIFGYVSVDAEKLFCSEYIYVSGLDAGLPGLVTLIAPRPDDLLILDWWNELVEVEI
jgi:hypothetical protein